MFGNTRGTKEVLELFRKTENHEMPSRNPKQMILHRQIKGIHALKLEPMIVTKGAKVTKHIVSGVHPKGLMKNTANLATPSESGGSGRTWNPRPWKFPVQADHNTVYAERASLKLRFQQDLARMS